MSRATGLAVQPSAGDLLDVDYLDAFDDVPDAASEALLMRMVPDRQVAHEIAARLSQPAMLTVDDDDVRSTMAALNFVPAQEWDPSAFADDED